MHLPRAIWARVTASARPGQHLMSTDFSHYWGGMCGGGGRGVGAHVLYLCPSVLGCDAFEQKSRTDFNLSYFVKIV